MEIFVRARWSRHSLNDRVRKSCQNSLSKNDSPACCMCLFSVRLLQSRAFPDQLQIPKLVTKYHGTELGNCLKYFATRVVSSVKATRYVQDGFSCKHSRLSKDLINANILPSVDEKGNVMSVQWQGSISLLALDSLLGLLQKKTGD